MKKVLFLEDLEKLCFEKKLFHFSAKETGYQLCVQVPAQFEESDYDDETMLFAYVRLFHIGKNRNQSSVTMEAAEKCMPFIKYKPVLANFCEIDGVRDFTSHDMEFNDDGTVTYIERQVGCFTADEVTIKHNDEYDRDYVYAKIAIPRNYTDAAEIIERKNGTKISVELLINEMSYSNDDKCLLLTDVTVQGATLLGRNPNTGNEVQEGMEGARVDLTDFSEKNNSVFSHTVIEQTLIETLEKLNTTISNFNINLDEQTNAQKGVTVGKFEILLEKYNVTIEDIDFEYEGLTDEELEAKFAEKFEEDATTSAEDETVEEAVEPETEETTVVEEPEEIPTEENNTETSDEPVVEEIETQEVEPEATEELENTDVFKKKKRTCSLNVGTKEFTIDISAEEKSGALEILVNDIYMESDDCYYCVITYDEYVVMIDYWSGVAYKQSYKEENGIFTLVGDRERVFANYLTADEENAIKELRSNYSSIEAELNQYKEAEISAKKDEILNDTVYAEFADTEYFKEVIKNIDTYSVDEFRNAMDLALAKSYKTTKNFAAENKQVKSKVVFSYVEPSDNDPYGDYFKSLKK